MTADIDAWGAAQTPAKAAGAAASADIYAKLATAEALVETKATAGAAALGLSSAANLDLTAETAGYSTYNTDDTAENLALTIAQSEMATKKIALDGALASAVVGLEAVTTSDVTGSLQALVDTWIAKAADLTAANTANTAAAGVVVAKNTIANAALDFAFDVSGNDTDFVVTASAGALVFDSTSTGTAFGDYKAVYDATTNAWTYSSGDASASTWSALTAAQAAADVNLQKLLANADAKADLDAVAAKAEAVATVTAATAAKLAALNAVEAVNSGLTDATTLLDGTDLTGAADAYRDAQVGLTAYTDAKTALDAAIAATAAPRADAVALAALEKAVATATTAINSTAWNLGTFGGAATAEKDVFVFGSTTVDNAIGGFSTSDVIKFGAGAYTLVKVAATGDWGTKAVGSATALEIFVQDDGANTVLHVEKNAFDGSSVAAQTTAIDITLTGVTGKEVSLDAHGYLHIA